MSGLVIGEQTHGGLSGRGAHVQLSVSVAIDRINEEGNHDYGFAYRFRVYLPESLRVKAQYYKHLGECSLFGTGHLKDGWTRPETKASFCAIEKALGAMIAWTDPEMTPISELILVTDQFDRVAAQITTPGFDVARRVKGQLDSFHRRYGADVRFEPDGPNPEELKQARATAKAELLELQQRKTDERDSEFEHRADPPTLEGKYSRLEGLFLDLFGDLKGGHGSIGHDLVNSYLQGFWEITGRSGTQCTPPEPKPKAPTEAEIRLKAQLEDLTEVCKQLLEDYSMVSKWHIEQMTREHEVEDDGPWEHRDCHIEHYEQEIKRLGLERFSKIGLPGDAKVEIKKPDSTDNCDPDYD